MLFLIHQPTQLLLVNRNKIILTTSYQLVFTSLHFVEEFLSKALASLHPEMLAYDERTSEAAVANKHAIQIYWTDWHSKIQLRCFVALSEEPLYSLVCKDGWTAFGEFKQYSPKQVKLFRCHSYDRSFSSCFLGGLQFILTNKRLVCYDHLARKLKDIEWENREDDTAMLNEEVCMKAKLLVSGQIVLTLDQLCVIVREQRVEGVLYHQGTLHVSEDVILWLNSGTSMMTIYHFKDGSLICLGETKAFEGYLLACTITEERLTFVVYDFKELHVKHMRFVEQQENMEYERNQMYKKQLKEGLRNANEQKIDNSNSSKSPKNGSLQLALKAQIQKFQEELHKSFTAKDLEDQNAESKANHEQLPSKQPTENLHQDAESRIIQACGLFQQGQSGFQWQQMESNYEQPLVASGLISPVMPLEHQIQCFAETPAFNETSASRWNQVQGDWNFSDEGNAIEEIEESEKTIEAQGKSRKSSKTIKSKDVRKYTQMLAQMFRKQPEKFDEALQENIEKVIHQSQARIFFADHIRIHNPMLTRDRLYRLYCFLPENQENKRLMGKALSDFRLEEVPSVCLPISKEFICIFEKIYPSVYVENLLQPSLTLLEELVQSYFSKAFNHDTLLLEGECIYLAHPRNLLNILLYLNDAYQFHIEDVFEVYIRKMIRYAQISILKKIMEGKVCQICGVGKNIFERCAERAVKELLLENKGKSQLIQQVMLLMSAKAKNIYVEILSLLSYFNEYQLKYKIEDILNIPKNKNSSQVIGTILQDSPADAISKISLPFIFKSLGKIQTNRTFIYYLPWHFETTKEAAQILMKNGYFKDAVSTLFPIVSALKRGFVASLLIKYLNGKLANRLVCPKEPTNEIFSMIFAQIMENEIDELPEDSSANMVDDEWQKFASFCKGYLSKYKCWQLAYIINQDRQLAKELITYEIISQNELDYLSSTLPKKKATVLTFQVPPSQLKIPLFYDADSHKSNGSAEFNQSYSPKSQEQRLILQQSFKGYDNVKFNHQLQRSLRKDNDGVDPALILLKIEVQSVSILAMLKEIYEEYPREKFIAALSMFDREKVQLHHIEVYKSLCQFNVDYDFQELIPFEYFQGEEEKAWKMVERAVKTQLDHSNFWTIYLLVDLLYNKGSQITFCFLERVILYEMDDRWSQSILQMLKGTKISYEQLMYLSNAAAQRGLTRTCQALSFAMNDFQYNN